MPSETIEPLSILTRDRRQPRINAVLQATPAACAEALQANTFKILNARLCERSVGTVKGDRSLPPVFLRVVVSHAIAEAVSFAYIDARKATVGCRSDKKVETWTIELISLSHRHTDCAAWNDDRTSGPLIDSRLPNAVRVVFREEKDDLHRRVSVPYVAPATLARSELLNFRL